MPGAQQGEKQKIQNRRPFGADINPIGADGGRFLRYTEHRNARAFYFQNNRLATANHEKKVAAKAADF